MRRCKISTTFPSLEPGRGTIMNPDFPPGCTKDKTQTQTESGPLFKRSSIKVEPIDPVLVSMLPNPLHKRGMVGAMRYVFVTVCSSFPIALHLGRLADKRTGRRTASKRCCCFASFSGFRLPGVPSWATVRGWMEAKDSPNGDNPLGCEIKKVCKRTCRRKRKGGKEKKAIE